MTGRLRSPLAALQASSYSNGLLKSFSHDIIVARGDTLIGSWGIFFFLPSSYMSEPFFWNFFFLLDQVASEMIQYSDCSRT